MAIGCQVLKLESSIRTSNDKRRAGDFKNFNFYLGRNDSLCDAKSAENDQSN